MLLPDRPGHWTYTGNLATSNKDVVRFLCGDVDDGDPQVSDEEIAFALTDEGNVYAAAAVICEHLSARWAREASRSINAGAGLSTSINLSERSKAYAQKAKDLRVRASTSAGMVYAGGISQSDKEANQDDTNLVPPAFFKGMFDNP